MSTQVGTDPFNRVSDPQDICAGKHGGVATSREAFQRAKHGIIESQQEVLLLARVSPNGITCKEAAAILGKDMSSVSPRFTELTIEQNLLRRLDEKRDGCYVHILEPNAPTTLPAPVSRRGKKPIRSFQMFLPDDVTLILRDTMNQPDPIAALAERLNAELKARVS